MQFAVANDDIHFRIKSAVSKSGSSKSILMTTESGDAMEFEFGYAKEKICAPEEGSQKIYLSSLQFQNFLTSFGIALHYNEKVIVDVNESSAGEVSVRFRAMC